MIDGTDIEEKLNVDVYTAFVIGIALAFFIFRAWLATQSGFGFHQGWNEGHYALIGRGFLDHPLVPKYGTHYVYNVPPLFPYTVAASFVAFGESVFAARLPSIVAATLTIPTTYALGVEVYDDRRTAALGASLLAVLPYFQLYGGRAQTDVMMLLFFTASLLYIVRGYTNDNAATGQLAIGGALFALAFAAKQPAVILPAVVLVWLIANCQFDVMSVRKTGVLITASAVSLAPLVLWFYLNYRLAPVAFVNAWEHELLQRTAPFANLKLLFLIGFGLGMGPVVLAAVGAEAVANIRDAIKRTKPGWVKLTDSSIVTWWLVLYGVFVLYRTPHGHQYYAVALTPPIALVASRGTSRLTAAINYTLPCEELNVRHLLITVLLVSAATGTIVLFELSGEYSVANNGGEVIAQSSGTYLSNEVSSNDTVLVASGYRPVIQWYTRSTLPTENIESYRVEKLTMHDIRNINGETGGQTYIVYVSPSWNSRPLQLGKKVHTTQGYKFSVIDRFNKTVAKKSKFRYYVETRQIVVYQFQN